MRACPICNAPQTDDECHCGFSFVETRIVNRDLIRSHMAKLKHDSWQQLIKTKHRINETQKLGVSKIAELLGETKGLTSNHLKLAQALIAYPELESCPNISRANERLNQLSNSAIPGDVRFAYEADLQDILFSSWSTIPEFAHFNLVQK